MSSHLKARVSHPALALALLAFAQAIIGIDFGIVFTALPSIGKALQFNAFDLQWVVSAYTLAIGGFILLGGRATDLLGRRRIFVIGLVLYAAASLMGGLAEVQLQLIIARAIQGLAGALLFPATVSMIATTFEEGPARNRALGVWSAAGAAGGALGVFLGGLLTSTLGWEWVFFVNVPFAAAAAVLAPVLLPRGAGAGLTWRQAIRQFDLLGASAVTAAALLLVYGLVEAPVVGWDSPTTWIAIGASAICGVLFAVIERRVPAPMVPASIFRHRGLVVAVIVAFAFMAIFGSQFYLLNLWLQEVRGFNAFNSGLGVLPLSIAIVIGAQVGRRLANQFSVRATLVGGLLVGAGGLLYLGVGMSQDGAYWSHVLPGIVISGLGQGVCFTSVWISSASGIPASQAGVASGITSTAQQIGAPVGLSLLVAIANHGQKAADKRIDLHSLVEGLHNAFFTTAILAVAVAVLVAALTRSRVPGTRRNETTEAGALVRE